MVDHTTPDPEDFKNCPFTPQLLLQSYINEHSVALHIVGKSIVLFVKQSQLPAVIYPAPLVNTLLFVGISLVRAIVPVDVGNVKVPVFEIVEITGDVKVLFVKVWVALFWVNSNPPHVEPSITTMVSFSVFTKSSPTEPVTVFNSEVV